MYSEVGAPAQTDLYALMYSPSGHYDVGAENAEALPSQCETVDQPLAQLNLPQVTPVDKKAWWHPSSWGRQPAPQPHFYNVEWRPQERHPQPVQQPPPHGAYGAVDPFGAWPIMQSQAPPPQQAGAQWSQPFQPMPISQQQIARVLPNHARRDESPRKKKTRKMEGEKESSSSSSGLHSDSSPSSSLSSLPASGYVDSINQSSPLDCYVFAPSSSSLSAATTMDYGSTGQTPQPTGPAHYYEPVYMDASPTASGPFAPRVIFQAYGAPVVAAAPAPSPPARVRDWNEEFQRVRMIPQQHRAEPLYLLTKDFVSTATSIGKKIIMEAHTAEWLKTIQPKDAGGVAGGEKYIEEGIFFKFAKDSLGLYGGDEFAAKACNHELRGLNALLNCWVDGLHFPMLCLVDFLGFRLIASSILPITNKTLIYGSGDGGLTVANSSPEFGDKVALAARILNLKAHLVGRSGKPQLLHLAGDVEGHKGTDGRFYILDTARVFPPDVPKVSIRCGHLYRLLRPELVKQNPVPLSSDAFSRWGLHRAAQHNKEVVEAARRLTSEIIPAFIAHLRETLADGSGGEGHHHRGSGVLFDFWPTNIGTHIDGELLTQQMHRRGINARYLSTIYTALATAPDSAEAAAKLVMTEMVARVVKAMLRTRLRAAEETDSWARARGETVKLFNALFFGDALLSTICTALLTKFELQLDQATVKRGIDREALFLRLQKMAGARFVHDAIHKLRRRPPATHQASFAESDIVELEPTVKSMRFVSMYEGFALLRKAEEAVAAPAGQQPDEPLDQQRRLYLEAIDKFKECLSAMPDEPNAMMNWGYAFMKLAEMEHRPDVASLLFDAAVAKYEEALGMKYSLNASIYTQAQAMYNMGLCFYHHAGFLRRANTQPEQQRAPDESSGSRREEELRLLARAEAQFAELHGSGRMGQVSGNVLYLLACVHALTNSEHQCQECLEGALTAGQLSQALLARDEFHALRDREWFRLLHQRAPV